MDRRIGKVIIFSFLLLTLSGCATVYNPATKKQEVQFITTQQEVSIGSSIARQVEEKFGIINDPALEGRLNFVGQRLAAVSDRRDLAYHFKIVNQKSVNALTILGGYIYVHKGLIDKVSSDSELASVVAHEIGHAAARHNAKRLEADMGYQLLSGLVFSNPKYANLQRAVDISVELMMRGYGREDELLADKLGIKYMMRAGYNPQAFVNFLEKLQSMESGQSYGIGDFLSDHPSWKERIVDARAEISWLEINGLQ